MDQLRALVALFPEMLQDRDEGISETRAILRIEKDVLCRYEHSIFPRHARRKGCSHKSNEVFEIIASIACIIGHRDLLHGAISDGIRIGRPTART
jgi:hypothetical protein